MIPTEPAAETTPEPSEGPTTNASAVTAESESVDPASSLETAKKPMPALWIPAILGIGLLIAAVYLGARIFTANHRTVVPRTALAKAPVSPKAVALPPVAAAKALQVPQVSEVPAKPAPPAPAPQVASSPKTEPAAAPPPTPEPVSLADIPTITPKAGERYIQVGALDEVLTRRYLPQLRQEKLEPHVAPGPSPDLLRILIGPFPDRDALNATKTELDKAGIANFVRKY